MMYDWLLRRFAQQPSASNVIYKLENYTCDGTAATAINTGLYLFDTSRYPNGWDLYFDFTVNSGNGGNASFLRCRNAATPYNGFTIRRGATDSTANNLCPQINATFKNIVKNPLAGTRFIITIETPYQSTKTRLLTDGSNEINVNIPTSVISPLVIGGELADDTTQEWNPERFSYITIHSLIIISK